MSGTQLENVLDLIDSNLAMNIVEVRNYIDDNKAKVVEALMREGQVDIPTSAGPITIKREHLQVA